MTTRAPDSSVAMSDSPTPKRAAPDEGLDVTNIITSKRRRKPTKRLVDSQEWQAEYRHLILEDVPDSELAAALDDEHFEDGVAPETDDEDEDDDDDADDVDGFVVSDESDDDAEGEYTDNSDDANSGESDLDDDE